MKPNPIVFLDFDGVVHPVPERAIPSTWKEIEADVGRRFFQVPQLSVLNSLCAEVDAEIVLISSWRMLDLPLSVYGSLFNHRLIEQTPECVDAPLLRRRETEICRFLSRRPPTPYVILDDQRSHYSRQLPRLVKINGEVGLSQRDAEEALMLLSL